MRNKETNAQSRVLVASPDIAYASLLARQITIDGHIVERCHDAKGVLRIGTRRKLDVLLLDLDLADEADVDLVSFIHRQNPDTQLVLLFDVTKIERAIEGIRKGAFFYLPKSSQPADVAYVVSKAIRSLTTHAAVQGFEQTQFEELLGATPAMRRVIELTRKVAPTDSTVLLLGESGTGKELLAHTVHRLSTRREMPFIAINCAALPETLLESEMFGHVKGAFTGAESDKRGLFEEADGGTIFLDEIGDMALLTQAKLLRVLQDGEIRPVGASTSRRVDVRVIAATNRDLTEAVAVKSFREDLYFRLNVIQIRIPPLRERMEALPHLVNYFLARFSAKYGKPARELAAECQAVLRNYEYPGNVRELESIIAHAVILSDDEVIRAHDLPDYVHAQRRPLLALPYHGADDLPNLEEMEKRLIRTALDKLRGNQSEAAKQLGISRSTLWRKIKQYGLTT
ncbi:MAG: sigma 54-interacting transcriptional regulator [Candidatus Hydrogenedentes bacterium]|nr:sigma 54-interacting transcriptional regulator [Candidatus Hydrogenedentota bacterium]